MRKIRVLLIDDEPDDRLLAIRTLKEHFEVEAREIIHQKGFEEALEKDGFDVVITDYQLHWSNGIKVLKEIKARYSHCPVIMFSGTGTEEIAVEAMKHGLDDYIIKSPKHFIRLPVAVLHALERAEQEKIKQRAEQELVESEKRFRSMFENATVGMYRTTPEGKIMMVNPFLVKLLGYTSEEELKRRDLNDDAYCEPGYERKHFIKEIEKKGYFIGEQAWKRKDGSTIFVRESAVAVRGEKGKTLYYDGVVEDITELKKTHDELAKARDDWEAIFNSISDPVIVLSRDHIILDANPATLRALGKKKEEVVGKKCFEFFHETDEPAEDCPMETLLSSKHAETETLEMDALGGIFLVTVSPVLDGREITKVIHHAKDITQLKQLIASLQESEERYRTLAENAEEAIIIHDMDGRISYINEYGAKIGGYSQKELIGRNVIEFVPPEYHEDVKKNREAQAKGDASIRKFEMELQVKKGKRIPFEIISSVITLKGERHILLIARNITERKEAEKALRESEERYRSLFENSLNAIAIHTVVTDKKGKPVDYVFVGVNRAFERETGLKAEDMVGKKVTEVLPDMDRTFIEKYGKIALTGGTTRFETYSAPLKKHLEISAFALGKGSFVTIFRDISSRIKHMGDLRFLADSVAQLNEMDTPEQLYRFVAQRVQELSGNAIVAVSSHEPETKFHVVQAVEGLGKHTSTLLKLLGKDIVGMTFSIHDPKRYDLERGKLVEMPDDIHELSSGKIPKSAASALKKLLGIGNIYSIDLIRGDTLFGNVTIVTRRGEQLDNKQVIETFIRQASIALQRIQAQQAVRESEEKYRTLVDNANDGICIIQDGVVKFANPRLIEMGGYSEEEIMGKPFSTFVAEEALEEVAERYRRRMAGEEEEGVYEAVLKKKDGSRVFAELNVSLIEYAGGKAELVIIRNVTEKKRAEERIKHLNLVLRAIREVNQLITHEKERDKLLQGLCENLIEHRGYQSAMVSHLNEHGELVIDAYAGFDEKEIQKLHTTHRETLGGCMERALKEQGVTLGECPLREEHLTMSTPIAHSGNIYGVLSVSLPEEFAEDREEQEIFMEVASDIAFALHSIEVEEEREHAAAEVMRLKEFNENIVQRVAEIILIEDAEGTITFVNRAGEELLGYSYDELVGCSWTTIVPEEEHEKVQKELAQRSKDRESRYETVLLRKDGRRIPIMVSARPLFENGEFSGVLSVLMDITERKEAEEKLQHAYREVERALKEEQKFKMATAHYFFNPIAIAKGYLDLALEEGDGEDKIKKAIAAINRVEKVVKNVTQRGEIRE